MNVHAWVVFLLFESFLNLFNVQNVQKKLKSQNWSSTNSARLLELLCRIKVNQFDFPRMAVNLVAQVARLDVSMCNRDWMQILHRSCSIAERYHHAIVVNGFLFRRLVQRFSQQLHDECRFRRFIGRKNCDNVLMLAGFQDCKLPKKLIHHLLIKFLLLDAFQGCRGFFDYQGACKNHPRCTCGEPILGCKDFEPVGVVSRGILWVNFDWFIAVLWTVSKKHGPKGQSLRLPYPIWLLGPGSVKKTLDVVCSRAWATCCMHVVSKPFWFGKHVRTRRFLRNACNVSEPLAASRFRCGSKYVSNYNVITYVYWFKNGTVSVSICHTACVISWYNMFALCNANIILANWPQFLRNCPSQFPHSWVENCRETGQIWAISMVRDVISLGWSSPEMHPQC